MSIRPNNRLLPNPERREPYGPGEDTLRLIAQLPAPEGLPDRVRAGLRTAPQPNRILLWRGALRPPVDWMYSGMVRGLAAAAIVCVVAGGGWRIYSHVLTIPAARAVLVPEPVTPVTPGGSGFSPAGARRVPETLDGPVLKHPIPPASDVVPPASDVDVVNEIQAQPKASPVPKKKKVHSRAAAPLQ